MKPTFLNQSRPLITSMINRDADPVAVRYAIKNSICDGADAIGIQLCKLKFEYRTEEHLKTMFAAAGQRPIYITNYRMAKNENLSYEECMNGLLMGLRYGATLADIMGDTFDKSEMELTKNPSAIDRQRKLIDQIHAMDKEVLMSSHILKFTPAEVVLEVALEHQRRGADISKIVTFASSEEEEMENLRITTLLKKELDIPFLFLSGGTHSKIHRRIGPMLGCVTYLAVQSYDVGSVYTQPTVKAAKAIRDNFDYLPDICW